jgi:hypothetical protein
MRSYCVVETPPLLDDVRRVDPMSKPFQAQPLIPELAVERFVGAILPRLPGIIERRRNPHLVEAQ